MNTVEIEKERLRAYIRRTDADTPVTMLNLLKYRKYADYSGHAGDVPCSGREAFFRYAKGSFPIVNAIGGKVIFIGTALGTIIGPDSEHWDDVLIVQYPSRKAFFGMLDSAPYRAVVFHRTAGLEDSRLIAAIAGKAGFQP